MAAIDGRGMFKVSLKGGKAALLVSLVAARMRKCSGGFFVGSLAQQVYIRFLWVDRWWREDGRGTPDGWGVFVYRYTPLTVPQKIKKSKNPSPKKPPSRKRDFPKINQPNFGIGGLAKTNKRETEFVV